MSGESGGWLTGESVQGRGSGDVDGDELLTGNGRELGVGGVGGVEKKTDDGFVERGASQGNGAAVLG